MPSIHIRCCPFCGSHEVEIHRSLYGRHWLRCASCGAEHKTALSRGVAIAQWNQRHFDEVSATIVLYDDRTS